MASLFVYGTLAPGKPNAHILAHLQGTWSPGVVKGHLHNAGWGAQMGYPGIVLDSDGDDIAGLVFTSAELENYWPQLDEFEGDGYARVETRVVLDDGSNMTASIYTVS